MGNIESDHLELDSGWGVVIKHVLLKNWRLEVRILHMKVFFQKKHRILKPRKRGFIHEQKNQANFHSVADPGADLRSGGMRRKI
jgi:hypothetical protein